MILIGLAGRKGAGKDTLANSLLSWWTKSDDVLRGGGVYHMADALKKVSIDLFGVPYDSVYGTQQQKEQATQYGWGNMPTYDTMSEPRPPRNKKMTGREFLQYFGTEICRTMCDSVHIDATMRKIFVDDEQSSAVEHLAIVADLRFPNECDAIRRAGGKVILMARGDSGVDEHISENSLEDYEFDAIIDNTLMTKSQQLDAAVTYLREAFQLS